MAVLDPRSDEVVIRIIYDGPPMAGKTTSVAALARRMGGQVITPDEIDGRTVFFDWLDYTGGLFEGRQIRCQIVSVPGQASLAPRRRRLLESADVVVFVCDSTPEAFESSRGYLTGLSSALASIDGPPVGIVVQANKRDHPNAAPVSELRKILDGLSLQVGITESIATEGVGVREAFVFAVRLALDRVRELMSTEHFLQVKPEIDSAEELLAELRQAEAGAMTFAVDSRLSHTRLNELLLDGDTPAASMATDALEQALSEDAASTANLAQEPPSDIGASVPATPGKDVPGGMIWPPVNGRIILHDVASAEVELQQLADGEWSGVAAERWRLHSAGHAVFAELEQGRAALLQWARMHAASTSYLSVGRCLVLADDGHGQFRLWQIVAVEKSLYKHIEQALTKSPTEIVTALVSSIRLFLQAIERYSKLPYQLNLSFNNVGSVNNSAVFIGLMPHNEQQPETTIANLPIFELISNELEFAQQIIRDQREELLLALDKHHSSAIDRQSDAAWQIAKQLLGHDLSNGNNTGAYRRGELALILDKIIFEQPLDQIFRISNIDFSPLYVVPAHQSYYLDAPVSALKEIATSTDFKVHTLPLPKNINNYLQSEAKPLPILFWSAGMYGGNGTLLPWLDPEASYCLKQWPDFSGLAFQPDQPHMMLATQLYQQPTTIIQLQQLTQLPKSLICNFINACAMCNYLDTASPLKRLMGNENVLNPSRKTGLIARIRERLGI